MPKMPSMPSNRGRSPASKLKRAEANGSGGILAVILVAVSLIVFTLSGGKGDAGIFAPVQMAAQTIVSPLRMAGSAIMAPFTGFGNVFRNLTADEKTLSELKEENDRLAARNVELEEAEINAKNLQALLDLRNTYNLQSLAAHVIAGSTDSWTSSVTIDKGSGAGVRVGMPVMDSNGAVGQVISCAPNTAVVRLLSDEGSSVSAMIQKSRAQGMVTGSPDGTLHLSFIRTDQTVDMGDIVVTSGLGGVFPKGMPLGKIVSVESSPGSTYYSIVVEPYSQVRNLEEVLVVTSLTEEQEATASDIEEADKGDLDAASGQKVESAASIREGQDDSEEKQETGEGTSEDGETSSSSSSSQATNTNSSSSSSRSRDSQSTTSEESTGGYVSPHTTTGRE